MNLKPIDYCNSAYEYIRVGMVFFISFSGLLNILKSEFQLVTIVILLTLYIPPVSFLLHYLYRKAQSNISKYHKKKEELEEQESREKAKAETRRELANRYHVYPRLEDKIPKADMSFCSVKFIHRHDIDFIIRDLRKESDPATDDQLTLVAKELLSFRKKDLTEHWSDRAHENMKYHISGIEKSWYSDYEHQAPIVQNLLYHVQTNLVEPLDDDKLRAFKEKYPRRFPTIYMDVDPILAYTTAQRILFYLHSEVNKQIWHYVRDGDYRLPVPPTSSMSRKIYLGDNLNQFVNTLGYVNEVCDDGVTKQKKTQSKHSDVNEVLSSLAELEFYFNEQIHFDTTIKNVCGQDVYFERTGLFRDEPPAINQVPIRLFEKYVSWDSKEKDSGYVVLNKSVYHTMIKAPLLIDLEHVRKMFASPLAFDLYSSIVGFLGKMRREIVDYFSFDDLCYGYGRNYSKESDFFKDIPNALRHIFNVFPELEECLEVDGYEFRFIDQNESLPDQARAAFFVRLSDSLAKIRVFDCYGELYHLNTNHRETIRCLKKIKNGCASKTEYDACCRVVIGYISKNVKKYIKLEKYTFHFKDKVEDFPIQGKLEVFVAFVEKEVTVKLFNSRGKSFKRSTNSKDQIFRLEKIRVRAGSDSELEIYRRSAIKYIWNTMHKRTSKLTRFIRVKFCPTPLEIRESKKTDAAIA